MKRTTIAILVMLLATLALGQGRLTTAISSNPPTLDPQKTFNGYSFAITNQVYETMFRVTPAGEIEGLLAASWEFLDPSTLRVHLREGVSFTDGTPLDAAAVKASLERILDPATGAPGRFVVSAIDSVEVVDATTVDILTGEPFAPLLAHLAHPIAAIVPVAHGDDLARNPVGSGPYIFVSWEQSNQLLLKSNPDYWGGEPAISEVLFRIIPEVSTQVIELRSGGLDIIYNIPPDAFEALTNDTSLETTAYLGWGSTMLGMNTINPKLQDLRVRQALAHAVDKSLIIDEFLRGLAEPGVVPIPPTVRFAASDLADPYPYEPETAKALLAEAGASGLKLTLDIYQNPDLEAVAQVLQFMFSEVGIDLTIRVQEYAAYVEQTAKDDIELYLSGWGTVTLDADYTLYAFFHSSEIPENNVSRYRVAAIDALLDEARNNPADATRAAAYRDVQEMVLADAPMVTLYYPLSTIAKSPVLQGEIVRFSWINVDLRNATLAR